MKREDVYKAIDSERNYQEAATKSDQRQDMIPNLHLGDSIAAMQYNLDKAREAWYKNSKPHHEAMEYIRKICGLGVQMGEAQGMPSRHETKDPLENKCPNHYLGECAMNQCTDCPFDLKRTGALMDRFNYTFEKGDKVRFEPEIIKYFKKKPSNVYDYLNISEEILDKVGVVTDVHCDVHAFGQGSLYMVDVKFGSKKTRLMAGCFTKAE